MNPVAKLFLAQKPNEQISFEQLKNLDSSCILFCGSNGGTPKVKNFSEMTKDFPCTLPYKSAGTLRNAANDKSRPFRHLAQKNQINKSALNKRRKKLTAVAFE